MMAASMKLLDAGGDLCDHLGSKAGLRPRVVPGRAGRLRLGCGTAGNHVRVDVWLRVAEDRDVDPFDSGQGAQRRRDGGDVEDEVGQQPLGETVRRPGNRASE